MSLRLRLAWVSALSPGNAQMQLANGTIALSQRRPRLVVFNSAEERDAP